MGTMNREQRRAQFQVLKKQMKGYSNEDGILRIPIKGKESFTLELDTNDFDLSFRWIEAYKKFSEMGTTLSARLEADGFNEDTEDKASSMYLFMSYMRELFLELRKSIDDIFGEGTGDKIWGKGVIPNFDGFASFFEVVTPPMQLMISKCGFDVPDEALKSGTDVNE